MNNDNGNIHHLPLPPKAKSEPVFNMPPVTKALALVLCAAFLLQTYVPPFNSFEFLYRFAFVPERFGAGSVFGLVTYMFLHAGWPHILTNVATLMAFGSGVEKSTGGRMVLLVFFISGIFGAVVQFFLDPSSNSPLIGASGGVSGLFGAALLMMQEQGALGQGVRLLPLIAIWIGVSLFFGAVGMPGAGGAIAWAAHVGGLAAGLVVYKAFKK